MKETIQEDMGVEVSLTMVKRAKVKVIKKVMDARSGEYSRLFDYALELKRSNPGSSVHIALDPKEEDHVFHRIYICLDACRRGFLDGCRRVIGLDGCFLKGPMKGELLSAIGRDANNQIYPIAWAVVEYENLSSWKWFLGHLQKDLNIPYGADGWVFITDKQKGLIKAIDQYFPMAEHRMCARHIYANWRKSIDYRSIRRDFGKLQRHAMRFSSIITRISWQQKHLKDGLIWRSKIQYIGAGLGSRLALIVSQLITMLVNLSIAGL
jgi:hypothetical protein